MSACIYFSPEAYSTNIPKLMGRNAAGESFLRGMFLYSKTKDFWVLVDELDHARYFASVAKNNGRDEAINAIDRGNLPALARAGSLYFPGPDIARLAWQRATYGHHTWSLCGITHTTSSMLAMDAIVELFVAPVQPWDALICTSVGVRDNINRVLQAQKDYLVHRLGIQHVVLPQLPVIPLGVHAQDFALTDLRRQEARQQLAIDDNTLVVLYTGRLSFHAKSHPLCMYMALEGAVQKLSLQKQVVLVECGWHANSSIAKAYADASRVACPSVRVISLDGRKAENREVAWAGADIFCSLADNIQETFGLVPIEAMAAGLPVIVSDWDGYKDTVRDGVDGFRIPTLMPNAGLGEDIALQHALEIDSYDMYCGYASMLIAVDVGAAENAFMQLLASPELRRRMGDAGKARARSVFDWSTIIPKYESLWEQLNEIRKARVDTANPLRDPWPARLDPFYAFSSYSTETLLPSTILRRVVADPNQALHMVEQFRDLAMVNYAHAVLPTRDEAASVLRLTNSYGQTAYELVRDIPGERRAFVFRSLAWLIKLGILQCVRNPSGKEMPINSPHPLNV